MARPSHRGPTHRSPTSATRRRYSTWSRPIVAAAKGVGLSSRHAFPWCIVGHEQTCLRTWLRPCRLAWPAYTCTCDHTQAHAHAWTLIYRGQIHVCTHVFTHHTRTHAHEHAHTHTPHIQGLSQLCAAVCINMCFYICASMWLCMRMDLCKTCVRQVCSPDTRAWCCCRSIDMCVDMCAHMCADMCVDLNTGMLMDMFVDM